MSILQILTIIKNNKMKRVILFLFVVFISQFAYSQETLLTINGNDISKAEFERIYLKNNNQATPSTDQDIDDYLQLFINFKLKVLEAENLGYDTLSTFTTEFNQYFSQLADPFFLDTAYENQMIKQAYERSKKEIRISYILIKSPETQDTAIAYAKAMEAYNHLQKGEDFYKVAIQYSETPSVRRDSGDGWYNRVFMMPYALENFTFNAKIGDISKPIFANDAYFILKITGTRTVPKRVRASHIYLRLPQNPSKADSILVFKRIDSIQQAFKSGKTFSEVVTLFSDDSYSKTHGGDLGWFSTGKMLRAFETAVYSIKNVGDSIGPIRSRVGYHFIKLTDVENLGSFADEKAELKTTLEKSDRYNLVKNKIYKDLKKEYNYTFTGDMNDFYTKVDTTLLKGKWDGKIFGNDNKILFRFADQEFTNEDFANYLINNQRFVNNVDMHLYLDNKFDTYVNKCLRDYELTQLPDKNEDFKYLMQEYHDGLLLFDITNDMVWDKAVKDTVGLRKYFNQNRNKYFQKVNIVVYSYSTDKARDKTVKLLAKKDKKGISDTGIVEIINKKTNLINLELAGVYKYNDNTSGDYVIDLMRNNKLADNQNIVVDETNKKIILIKDNLPYVKGLVTADYQDVLEKEWIANLRNKYSFSINQDVLNQVKSEN